ncbi:Uncharacterised protein [Mycobacteroides abscessus subsp. abscessus]|nr:Uncharacterised protein [Mycobacteroides abscessus subsp. abscessus]
MKARSTFAPEGRYPRPEEFSSRRNSPILVTWSATGPSASAQPGSTNSARGRAVTKSQLSRNESQPVARVHAAPSTVTPGSPTATRPIGTQPAGTTPGNIPTSA